MRKNLLVIAMLLLLASPSYAVGAPPDSATTVLKAAVSQARQSHKVVFLIFHASWCKWCTRLEAALSDPEMKTIIDENYLVTKMDVLERGDKVQSDENPGGREMMDSFGGKDAGLPFVVFLNGKGWKIADSRAMPEDQNIGYPGSHEEIAAFVKLLEKTAPKMTGDQRARIAAYLEKNAPK